jgi:hypothetical protein
MEIGEAEGFQSLTRTAVEFDTTRQTLLRWEKQGKFPKRVVLPSGAVVYYKKEIQAYKQAAVRGVGRMKGWGDRPNPGSAGRKRIPRYSDL